MRRFTAYIFDLDGVLCHTDKFHFAACAALAKNLDLPFDASVNDRLRGVSRMESLDIVLGEKKDAFTAEGRCTVMYGMYGKNGSGGIPSKYRTLSDIPYTDKVIFRAVRRREMTA